MIRNVIFDFGAVLFHWSPVQIVKTFTDSTEEQALLLEQVLRHPDWISLDRGTMLMAEVIPKFAARTGFSEPRMEDFIEHIQNSLVKNDVVLDLFYQILDHGYAVYYMTNMTSAFFETLNDRNSFISLFNGGIVSSSELLVKPEPEIFQLIAERYGLKPQETLFIDDHKQNIETAQRLGFHTVLFEQNEHCFDTIRHLLKIN